MILYPSVMCLEGGLLISLALVLIRVARPLLTVALDGCRESGMRASETWEALPSQKVYQRNILVRT